MRSTRVCINYLVGIKYHTPVKFLFVVTSSKRPIQKRTKQVRLRQVACKSNAGGVSYKYALNDLPSSR
jgi:hypothetical protein